MWINGPALGRLQAISACTLEEPVPSMGSITSPRPSSLTEVTGI